MKKMLLIMLAFMPLFLSAQEVIYDKTTDGMRLVSTSETICRDFTDELVLAVSLEAFIDEQRADTTFVIVAHLTGNSRLEVKDNSSMLVSLIGGGSVSLPTFAGDKEIVRDLHFVNGTILSSYDIRPMFSVTRQQIEAISRGVESVYIPVTPKDYNKSFRREKVGAAIDEQWKALCKRLSIHYVKPVRAKSKTSVNLDATDKPILFPKLFALNDDFVFGLMGVAVNNFNYGAIGLNATFCGFYADAFWWPRKHDRDISLDRKSDHYVYGFRGGYQIPIHKYLDGNIRLIPMLGYVHISEGVTDGSNWDVNSGGIINSYEETGTRGGLDYGGAVMFQNKEKKLLYNFYLGVTRYTTWISFGLGF